jgi:formimidoylglutamate deiminase
MTQNNTSPGSQGLYADALLTADGWAENVSLYFDARGNISSIHIGSRDVNLPVAKGPVIPGMVNLHSHAFQREMVGRTQAFSDRQDDFWSWRKSMYDFVGRLTPDRYRHQAEMLYREMVANGYTSVCEFHYVHNDESGRAYADPAVMSIALIEAASAAGIRLCLLPVLYMNAGFSGAELTGGQRRFGNSLESYARLMDDLYSYEAQSDKLVVGYAPHSLRAVSCRQLTSLLAHRSENRPDSPVHIHVAEQEAEVEACAEAHNLRPVEYLFESVPVDNRWCLIHATHLTSQEVSRIAASGAVAGLCPTTESDLGDGVFPLKEFVESGGRYGFGSDSNVSVSPGEEIRCLESMQRSAHKRRNVVGAISGSGIGTVRYQTAVSAGMAASGLSHPAGASGNPLSTGSAADFVILEPESRLLANKSPDEMLNAHLFSGSERTISSVHIAGQQVS